MHFNNQTNFYRGKVRDVYTISNKYLVSVCSDRISAFDVILPKPIPYKGQVLNQLAARMLLMSKSVCPVWLMDTPAPTVSVGKKCKPFKIEIVVRGNLVGHAWREYASGKRTLCGNTLPNGLKENDFFPSPIITPSTKAQQGHDEDISANEIIKNNLATTHNWQQLQHYALELFKFGCNFAQQHGLILADTKYEFGKLGDEIILIDEVHTPDSSRYFYADDFEKNQREGIRQKQLSKEFLREWLIENNFMGKPNQSVPEMTDDWVKQISSRYIELYEKVLAEKFIPADLSEQEIHQRIEAYLQQLS